MSKFIDIPEFLSDNVNSIGLSGISTFASSCSANTQCVSCLYQSQGGCGSCMLGTAGCNACQSSGWQISCLYAAQCNNSESTDPCATTSQCDACQYDSQCGACQSTSQCGACESVGQCGSACEDMNQYCNTCEASCQYTCQVTCMTTAEENNKPPSYTITNITDNSVTISISAGTYNYHTVYCRLNTSTTVFFKNVYDSSVSIIVIDGLSPETTYTVNVGYKMTQTEDDIGKVEARTFTTKKKMFHWDTDIYQGAPMNYYNNRPAPVTFTEWNRLVDATNGKCAMNISKVSRGQTMNASNNGNVKQVADALGVSIPSGKTVTAKFFLDLEESVNS